MDSSLQSHSPDNSDVKPSFRKLSNDKTNRKYRRRSPISGSTSSSSGGKSFQCFFISYFLLISSCLHPVVSLSAVFLCFLISYFLLISSICFSVTHGMCKLDFSCKIYIGFCLEVIFLAMWRIFMMFIYQYHFCIVIFS